MPEFDLAEVRQFLRDWAADREWEQFHLPKNLAMAVAGEAGELVEIFQWLTPEQAAAVADDPERKRAVADEIIDILQYLIRLADVMDVDLAEAFEDKFARNLVRYPADEVRGSAEKR